MSDPWSIDKCLGRLRKVKADCIEQNSGLPAEKFFRDLAIYVGKSEESHVIQNYSRMCLLWEAHFQNWFQDFRKGDSNNAEKSTDSAAVRPA